MNVRKEKLIVVNCSIKTVFLFLPLIDYKLYKNVPNDVLIQNSDSL